MPSKSGFPPLPYLDPEFNPTHPDNLPVPDLSEPNDYYSNLGKRELPKQVLAKREKEWRRQALEDWQPPHVQRSWETNIAISDRREQILAMELTPRVQWDHEDLVPQNPSISKKISQAAYDPEKDPDRKDFRRFLNQALNLGYHRFHHEYYNEPTPEPDVCWIMEYTPGECNIIRRKLAWLIGEFPAVVDEDNDLYNEELAYRYDRRLYAHCRRGNRMCIRPSHIEILTSQRKPLP